MKLFAAIGFAVTALFALNASAGTSLAPPAGYTTSQLTFEDQFTSSSLSSNWNPWQGNDQYGRWGDEGVLPSPYAGANCTNATNGCANTSGVYTLDYYDPYSYGYGTSTTGAHLTGGSGVLTLSASPSSYFASKGFTWAASAISSYGHVYLPAGGGYVQWSAKMPNSSSGGWGALWLLPGSDNNGAPEVDVIESGYISGSTNPNFMMASNFHASGASQQMTNTGEDLSAAFHTYGLQYVPGKSLTMFLDGKQVAQYTASVPTNTEYELLITLDMASANANGWHTLTTSSSPSTTMQVQDVQIYSGLPNTSPTTVAPTVPAGLTAGTVTSTSVALSWSASTDSAGTFAGYNILRNGTKIGTSTTPVYTDVTAVAGTTYSYAVQAYNTAGQTSASSNAISVTTTATSLVGTAVTSTAPLGCTLATGSSGTVTGGPVVVGGVSYYVVQFNGGCTALAPATGLNP